MIIVPLPALRPWGRRPFQEGAAAVGLVAEGVEVPEVGSGGGVTAWFRSGQLGPGADVSDSRGTGSRC